MKTRKPRRIEQIRKETRAAMEPIAKGRFLADELIAERRAGAAPEVTDTKGVPDARLHR